MSLRQYLYRHNITITLTDQATPQLKSPNDQFIMQSDHLQRYTNSQQRDINLVRIYLQVTTLADISDPIKPTAISLSHLDGKRPLNWTPQSSWPRQEEPISTQRRLVWKGYLKSSFLRCIPYWKTPPTTTNVRQPANAMQTDRGTITDSTLKGAKGTHGWVITMDKITLFQGSGPIDGRAETASSTRCELGGLAASLIMVTSLARLWGLRHSTKFNWYADSKAAISRVNKHTKYQQPNS